MSKEEVWDDAAREDLRESLRRSIAGELRLGRHDQEQILESCREVYIDDTCPEGEREAFVRFAVEEFKGAAGRLAAEQTGWPKETDCDRLDRVENGLRERGILLWQASPCCDTCTMSEIPDRIQLIDERHPGFNDRLRGYAFFIDQNLPDMLSDGPKVKVYLAYGWFSPDGTEVDQATYQKHAMGIADEVCECLRAEGLEPDWNGRMDRKIGISVEWRRRGRLE